MNHLSEEEQKKLVRRNWRDIESIENPTISVQLAAVVQNPKAIMCISNPSEELHLQIVNLFDLDTTCKFNILGDWLGEPVPKSEESYTADQVIVDWPLYSNLGETSEKVQHAMLDKGIQAFEMIKNPCESVQIRAVKSFWPHITRIKNPSEQVKIAAVLSDIKALEYVKDLTDESKLAIIKSGINFNNTIHAGYDIYDDNIYTTRNLFKHLGRLSSESQVEAVKSHWSYIKEITNPCEEAQLEAVKQSYLAIKSIKKPSEAAQQEAAMRCVDIIEKYNSGKESQYDKQKAIDIINKLSKKAQEIVVRYNWKLADYFTSNRIICYAASRTLDLEFKNSSDKNKQKPKLPYWYLKA